MNKPPLTPGQAALIDQEAAGIRDELDRLTVAIRAGDQARGEAQNLADFVSWLARDWEPTVLAALVVVAVRKL